MKSLLQVDCLAGRRIGRRGVTLIEMLVAMALSLMMMAAVAQLFATVSTSIAASRASIGLSETQRAVRNRIQNDLVGITASLLPPARPGYDQGYVEIVEGLNTDATAYLNVALHNTNGTAYDTLTSDADDVLMFTTQSKEGQPFLGKFTNVAASPINTITVESQTAEVAYFTVPNGMKVYLTDTNGTPLLTAGDAPATTQLYTLYRRALLVAPEYGNSPALTAALYPPTTFNIAGSTPVNLSYPAYFFDAFDLSAHLMPANSAFNALTQPTMVLNSLAELTKRENRFAHTQLQNGTTLFPIYFPGAAVNPGQQGLDPFPTPAVATAAGLPSRMGEDVLLTNVLAFDVKVYDPTVPLYLGVDGTTALLPSDVGYPWTTLKSDLNSNTALPNAIGYGGYVDLGYGYNNLGSIGNNLSAFSGPPAYMPGVSYALGYNSVTNTFNYYTYDTWTLSYEALGGSPGSGNGKNSYSSTGAIHNGINGLDDDGANGVDDPGEYQFPPPYSAPLRGIQVKIRTYEPDSRQIREITIVQDFLPQ